MTITAEQVKELRERTGAGMMECKKALMAAEGNIEAAIDAMRKAGTAKAAKKAGRVTAEGCIDVKVSADGKTGVMVEINCETDFVARDSNFKEFAAKVCATALKEEMGDIAQLSQAKIGNGDETVEHFRQELINKIGENIQIRRVALIKASGVVGSYVHGGRIGALVGLNTDNLELAKDLAMHVTASNPLTLSPNDVSEELIAKEKEIFMAQSMDSGKSVEIVEKMIAGRIKKFVNEISLMGQPFVKDSNKTVEELVKAAKAEVLTFARFEVGEGIEKVQEDFAEAVMAQISGGN